MSICSVLKRSLYGLRFQYTVNIKHCTANDLKTVGWLVCIIVLISIVSTKDVRLPHHKSLEEIYYRFCEFSRVKKKTFERQNLWILDLSCVLNYRYVYLFESQQKLIDTVYEQTIDKNLFLNTNNGFVKQIPKENVSPSQRKCALCVTNVPISKYMYLHLSNKY